MQISAWVISQKYMDDTIIPFPISLQTNEIITKFKAFSPCQVQSNGEETLLKDKMKLKILRSTTIANNSEQK